MTYLILKILFFILAALVLGFWLGASVYRKRYQMQIEENAQTEQNAEETLSRLEDDLSTAELALRSVTHERDGAKKRVSELEAEVGSADQRIEAAIARAEALEESLDKERSVLIESDEALRELREEHHKTLAHLEEAQASVSRWESDEASRTNELEVLVRDRDTWQADAQQALRRVAELESQAASSQVRIEGGEEERRLLRVQLESLEARTQDMVVRSNAQTSELARKDARISELEAMLAGQMTSNLNELPPLNEAGFFAARPPDVDDLKLISGVGPKLEGMLNDLGIYQFQQIALMTRSQVSWVNDQLSFKGRIERDNWIKQAANLSGINAHTDGQAGNTA